MIAALYIDPKGPYPKIAGVDCWDEARDAQLFAGPGPVVAHPPCGPWGKLKHLSRQDPRLAVRAVRAVREFGGVLEHPDHSGLWAHCGLPRPGDLPDEWGGWSLEVEQVRWGHVARKRTWIYIVGCGFDDLPPIPTMRVPTHWVSGGRKPRTGRTRAGLVPPGIKVCSAQQRRRTPPAFAKWLVAVAQKCRK